MGLWFFVLPIWNMSGGRPLSPVLLNSQSSEPTAKLLVFSSRPFTIIFSPLNSWMVVSLPFRWFEGPFLHLEQCFGMAAPSASGHLWSKFISSTQDVTRPEPNCQKLKDLFMHIFLYQKCIFSWIPKISTYLSLGCFSGHQKSWVLRSYFVSVWCIPLFDWSKTFILKNWFYMFDTLVVKEICCIIHFLSKSLFIAGVYIFLF